MSARGWARVVLVAATVLCAWLTASRLRLSGDMSALFASYVVGAGLVGW
jgi:hypothetical protein